ncbi:MAG: hypothetical protein EXS37_19650 [Opitutus sp.]|nr:hypothetical protein [Opitutus sp.]
MRSLFPRVALRFAIFVLAGGLVPQLFGQARYVITDLGPIGRSVTTDPYDLIPINASGQVALYLTNADQTIVRAALWQNGTVTDLGVLLEDTASKAWGMNDAGQIVGSSGTMNTSGAAPSFSRRRAVRFTSDGPQAVGPAATALYGINSAGLMVGDSGGRPVLIQGSSVRELGTLGGGTGTARAINAAGQVVGSSNNAVGQRRAFLYENGSMRDLGTLGGDTSSAEAINAATAQAGTYSCRVSTATGDYLSANAVSITAAAETAAPGRLINLSVLTQLSSAADTFTLGTVIGGPGTGGSKSLLVRAAGPSLAAFGLDGLLNDPRLKFFSGSAKSAENNDWSGEPGVRTIGAQVGAFAFASEASRDAAVYLAASPTGDKSVRISGTGAGTVIAEIYDATPAGDFTATPPRLVNLSVLKPMGTGLTAGFVVGGTTAKTVLVRAVGPTLATTFNIPGAVADPRLTLYAGQTKLAENDNWEATATAGTLNVITGRAAP